MQQHDLERILKERYKLREDGVQLQVLCKRLQGLDKEETALLEHGRLPEKGWSEHRIQSFLLTMSKADSPYNSKCGLGEREGRVLCPLIAARHFHLVHGIGRSGDLGEWQPKAAGSSLLYKLTNRMVLDFGKRVMGWKVKDAVVLPMATGMALFFCLRAFALGGRRKVLWFRADQKSAIKAVSLGGLELIVIPGVLKQPHPSIQSNLELFETYLRESGDEIAAVLSTTSCFAPRGCDDLPAISKLCQQYGIPHIINNAYGLQSPAMRVEVQKALRIGRIDAIVQSGDKNFLIPVSCAIVYTTSTSERVTGLYPGRASISGITDLFSTLMYLGCDGWLQLDAQRLENFEYLKSNLKAKNVDFVECRKNDISVAIIQNQTNRSLLHAFARGISGIRTVLVNSTKFIEGLEFRGWQAHHPEYPHPYVNVAVALGCTKQEIDHFIRALSPQ